MKIYNCRLCHGHLSGPKLNLGSTPLANEFVKTLEPQETFPLEVCVCEICGHYQLNESISAERLFRRYLFVAGTSSVNVEHFKQYALHMKEYLKLSLGSKILDIASNDGTLLQHFKDLGMQTLGIDPAVNIAEEANDRGIETIPEFFTETNANIILNKYGCFDLICANNVFAHVSDLIDFTKGVEKLLAPNGIFSFEVSYLLDVCDNTLFDTCYHEHADYHHLKPLILFFQKHNLKIIDVERIDTHGGSIRVFVKKKTKNMNVSINVYNMLQREKDIHEKILALDNKIKYLGRVLRDKLSYLKGIGQSIAVYGFPAKATTLMYALGIDEKWIDFAVDDAVLKQGTFSPGKHIPIFSPDEIYKRKPDVILILAWNFSQSIIEKNQKFLNDGGTFIVPIPKFKTIHGDKYVFKRID